MNGKPQRSVRTVPEDWVTKCDQNPRRVPGRRRLMTTSRTTWPQVSGRGASSEPGGRSRTTINTPTSARRTSPAALRNAGDQPKACRMKENGTAERICPICPMLPTHCETIGTRRVGNQEFTSRNTEVNTAASPRPTSIRPTIAPPSSVVRPSQTWPAMTTVSPAMISTRGPRRSMSTPTGTCMAAYTISCATARVDSAAASIWNRSVASTAATPSVDRCMTVMR